MTTIEFSMAVLILQKRLSYAFVRPYFISWRLVRIRKGYYPFRIPN